MPYKHRQVTHTTQGATSSEAVCISQEGTKAADLDRKICKLELKRYFVRLLTVSTIILNDLVS